MRISSFILAAIFLPIHIMSQDKQPDRTQLSLLVAPALEDSTNDSYYDAISEINNSLIQNGYLNTLDANTLRENTKTDVMSTSGIIKNSSLADKIRNAPADIVIETKMHWMDTPPGTTGRQLQIALKAVDKYTNYIYATTLLQSQQREFPGMERAVSTTLTVDGKETFQQFLAQLDQGYNNLLARGRQVTIKVEIAAESELTTSSKIKDIRISDAVEEYVKKVAFNGHYKVVGQADEYMVIQMQVPIVDAQGNSVSPSMFIKRSIDSYFDSYGITTQYTSKGNNLTFILVKSS
jgi:hypothetical protein